MDHPLSPEEFRDLMAELSETQRLLLAEIENRLAAKMHLDRRHLFGTAGMRPNALLQQGVIYLAKRHPQLTRPNDWLAEYLGLRCWNIEDFDAFADGIMRKPMHSDFGRAVLEVWRELYDETATSIKQSA